HKEIADFWGIVSWDERGWHALCPSEGTGSGRRARAPAPAPRATRAGDRILSLHVAGRDTGHDALPHVLDRGDVALLQSPSHQEAEPQLDLVQPTGGLWRIQEPAAMSRIAQAAMWNGRRYLWVCHRSRSTHLCTGPWP